MDTSTSTGRLIVALDAQLRARGINYRDVALRLKISERTVKRYFTGRGITLDVLQQLADVVDLDVLSLVVLAQQQSIAFPEMSSTQQAALRRNGVNLAVFYFLKCGMAPEQIARLFDFGTQIDGILRNLEALGLIRRLPTNDVKILATCNFGFRAAGHIAKQKIGQYE
jgi:transcriptional regulator with XRE-family HTH domain